MAASRDLNSSSLMSNIFRRTQLHYLFFTVYHTLRDLMSGFINHSPQPCVRGTIRAANIASACQLATYEWDFVYCLCPEPLVGSEKEGCYPTKPRHIPSTPHSLSKVVYTLTSSPSRYKVPGRSNTGTFSCAAPGAWWQGQSTAAGAVPHPREHAINPPDNFLENRN